MKGVCQRKSGNWAIRYMHKGRRIQEVVAPTKQLAEAILCKRLASIAENKHLDVKKEQKIKFKDFAQTYINSHAIPNKRSWETTDKHYLKKLVPVFGEKYLHEITPIMIEKYKLDRRKDVSVAYINRELACLKCMFNKAILWEMAVENPVRKVKLYKENNTRLRYLEREEIDKLLKNCSPGLRGIVLVAVNTGMRKAELQNLKWSDCNFQQSYVTLYHTKNGEKRIIPMNQTVKEALMSIRRHPESTYIFYGSDGLPYNFRNSFDSAVKRSGIINFHFHDLRHTFASQLVMAGVDLNTVRELLGHHSLEMTLRYAHLSPDHKNRAVAALVGKIGTKLVPSVKSTNQSENVGIINLLELAS